MERKNAEVAANVLFQSVEAALPRQKRVQATTHFKNAMIAFKRRSKTRDNDKCTGSICFMEGIVDDQDSGLVALNANIDFQVLLSCLEMFLFMFLAF